MSDIEGSRATMTAEVIYFHIRDINHPSLGKETNFLEWLP